MFSPMLMTAIKLVILYVNLLEVSQNMVEEIVIS